MVHRSAAAEEPAECSFRAPVSRPEESSCLQRVSAAPHRDVTSWRARVFRRRRRRHHMLAALGQLSQFDFHRPATAASWSPRLATRFRRLCCCPAIRQRLGCSFPSSGEVTPCGHPAPSTRRPNADPGIYQPMPGSLRHSAELFSSFECWFDTLCAPFDQRRYNHK